MNNRRALFLQSIRGPILLITIGTLLVWQQSGTISFSRTWPLILIVLGILKLLERVAGPANYPPSGAYSQQAPTAYPPQTPPPGGLGQ